MEQSEILSKNKQDVSKKITSYKEDKCINQRKKRKQVNKEQRKHYCL